MFRHKNHLFSQFIDVKVVGLSGSAGLSFAYEGTNTWKGTFI